MANDIKLNWAFRLTTFSAKNFLVRNDHRKQILRTINEAHERMCQQQGKKSCLGKQSFL